MRAASRHGSYVPVKQGTNQPGGLEALSARESGRLGDVPLAFLARDPPFTRTSIFAFYVALRSLSVFGSRLSVTSVSSLPHEQSRQVCESLHKLVQMRAWMQNALRKVAKKRKQVWNCGLCYAAENK